MIYYDRSKQMDIIEYCKYLGSIIKNNKICTLWNIENIWVA